MKGIQYYKDVFEAREFDTPESMAYLAYLLESEKKLEFNAFEAQEEFNQATNTFGLKIDNTSYVFDPILEILYSFKTDPIPN